jgi:hypothetical protein
MQNNLPPDSNPQNLASRESGIIKTERQLLIEAEKKIGQMENERRLGMEHIEKMKWQIAQLRMGVAALATHHGHTPDEVKVIYDAYCAAEDAKIAEATKPAVDAAKKKFMEDLAAGKIPEGFEVISRDEVPESARDTEAKPEDN